MGCFSPALGGWEGSRSFCYLCVWCVCVCAPSQCAFQRLDKKKFLVKVKDILVSLDFRSPSDGQMSFDNISLTLVLL